MDAHIPGPYRDLLCGIGAEEFRHDSRFYGTTELPNTVEEVAGAAQDKFHKE